MGIRDLLGRAVGYARGIFTLLGNVRMDELGESVLAFERLRASVAACDWGDAEDVGGTIDLSIVALKEAADCTETQIDDALADAIGNLAVSQRDFLISAITFLAGKPNATEAELQAAVADPTMPIDAQALGGNVSLWISLAIELWELIRAARGRLR